MKFVEAIVFDMIRNFEISILETLRVDCITTQCGNDLLKTKGAYEERF